MNQTMTDSDGAHWPITGHWCQVCGMPLHPANVAFGTHPGCDPEATS